MFGIERADRCWFIRRQLLINSGSQFPYAEARASCKGKQASGTDEQAKHNRQATAPRCRFKSRSMQFRDNVADARLGGSKDRGMSSDVTECGEEIEEAHDASPAISTRAPIRNAVSEVPR